LNNHSPGPRRDNRADLDQSFEAEFNRALLVELGPSAPPGLGKLAYIDGHEAAAAWVQGEVSRGAYPVFTFLTAVPGTEERVLAVLVDFSDHPWLCP
jgi:hypothetical protein